MQQPTDLSVGQRIVPLRAICRYCPRSRAISRYRPGCRVIYVILYCAAMAFDLPMQSITYDAYTPRVCMMYQTCYYTLQQIHLVVLL